MKTLGPQKVREKVNHVSLFIWGEEGVKSS